jgi:hypothetical protein
MRTTLDWPDASRKQTSPFSPVPGALTGGAGGLYSSGSGGVTATANVSPRRGSGLAVELSPARPFALNESASRLVSPRTKVSLPTTGHSWWCAAARRRGALHSARERAKPCSLARLRCGVLIACVTTAPAQDHVARRAGRGAHRLSLL